MTAFNTLDELSHAENPARALLEKLGWTYVPREALAAERDDEREVLLKGTVTGGFAAVERVDDGGAGGLGDRRTGAHRGQRDRAQSAGTRGPDLREAGEHRLRPAGRQSRIARFFDFEHPEGGLNEFVVTTQFRVRRGNERREPG